MAEEGTLVERLVRDCFDGVNPKWEVGSIPKIRAMLFASDEDNCYAQYDPNTVFYHPLEVEDFSKGWFCYGCTGDLQLKTAERTDCSVPQDLSIPYCPNCQH